MSYAIPFSSWSSTKQSDVEDAYYDIYLSYEGYDRLHLESFKEASTAF